MIYTRSHFFNTDFMQVAVSEALKAYEEGEVPIGAVIVNTLTNEIIIKTHNLVEQRNNSTMHAEIIAINQACEILGTKVLPKCDIYITLEPCSMCSAAISLVRINRLFYASHDPKQGAVENGVKFFSSSNCFHRPEIYQGLMEKESKELLKKFFKALRSFE